jgi:hypothetical protein
LYDEEVKNNPALALILDLKIIVWVRLVKKRGELNQLIL